MKLLMIIPSLGEGGAETHVITLALALSSLGCDCEVASAGGSLAEKLTDAGIRHIPVPLTDRSPVGIIRARNALKSVISSGGYDIVHAHARYPASLADGICKSLGIPMVTTAHWVFELSQPKRALTRWGCHTLAVSPDIRDYLMENYALDPKNITVTVNGIDTDVFSPSEKSKLRRCDILHVSRIDRGRSECAFALVRIAPSLAKALPNGSVTIVGGGDDFCKLCEAADDANRIIGREYVTLTGPETDVARRMRSAGMFIGVSRAALEAMSCALPVILAGDEGYGGLIMPERIADAAKTNFCCRECKPLDDSTLLCDIVSSASLPEEYLSRLGGENRAEIVRSFSAEKMARDAFAVYHDVLEKHNRHIIDSGGERYAEAVRENERCQSSAEKNCENDSSAREEPCKIREEQYKDREEPCKKRCSGEKKADRTNVVICGYYGHGNVGDELILESLLRDVRKSGDVSVTVISASPDETTARLCVRAIGKYDLPRILRAVRKCDVFILGGGNLLQDRTSCRSLLYYVTLFDLASSAGAVTVLASSGIGEIRRAHSKKLAARVLTHANVAFLRTEADCMRGEEMTGGNIHTVFSPDAALFASSQMISKSKRDELLSKIGCEDFFTVTLKDEAEIFGLSRAEYIERLAGIINCLSKKSGLRPVLVVMHRECDLEITCEVAYHVSGCRIIRPSTPADAIAAIGMGRFSFGMRLHHAVISLSRCVPFAMFISGVKSRDLLLQTGRGDGFCLPLPCDLYAPDIIESVLSLSAYSGDGIKEVRDSLIARAEASGCLLRGMIRKKKCRLSTDERTAAERAAKQES